MRDAGVRRERGGRCGGMAGLVLGWDGMHSTYTTHENKGKAIIT